MRLGWDKDHAGPWLMTNDIASMLSKMMRPCWSPFKSCRSAAAASCTNWTQGGFQPKILCQFLACVLLPDCGPPCKMKNLYRTNASVHWAVQGRSSSSTPCILESLPWSARIAPVLQQPELAQPVPWNLRELSSLPHAISDMRMLALKLHITSPRRVNYSGSTAHSCSWPQLQCLPARKKPKGMSLPSPPMHLFWKRNYERRRMSRLQSLVSGACSLHTALLWHGKSAAELATKPSNWLIIHR